MEEEKILRIKNLIVRRKKEYRTKGKVAVIEVENLDVKKGEILAIAGLEGEGQQEIFHALAGLVKPETGLIVFEGDDIRNMSVDERQRRGLIFVPGFWHESYLIPEYTIAQNLFLSRVDWGAFSHFGMIDHKAVRDYAQQRIKDYYIKANGPDINVSTLSGGNQQKVLLARELDRKYKLLVVMQPTKNLDAKSTEFVHELLLTEKKKGKAILLISYDIAEILAIADNVAILRDGKMVEVVSALKYNSNQIGEKMIKAN